MCGSMTNSIDLCNTASFSFYQWHTGLATLGMAGPVVVGGIGDIHKFEKKWIFLLWFQETGFIKWESN